MKKILSVTLALLILSGSNAAYATPVSIDTGITDSDTVYMLQHASRADWRQTFSQSYTAYKTEHPWTKMKVDDYKLTFKNFENDKRRLVVLAAFIMQDNPQVNDVAIEVKETQGKKRRLVFYMSRAVVEGSYDIVFPSNPNKNWYKSLKSKILKDDFTVNLADGFTVILK